MVQFIKGITLKGRVEFVKRTYGNEALASIVRHVGGEIRHLVMDPRLIKAISWYDFQVQQELDKAICTHLAGGDEAIYFKMGAFNADFQENTLAMSQAGDVMRYLRPQMTLYPRFFKPGRMDLIEISPTEVVLQSHLFKSTHENCETNRGFIAQTITNCGAHDVDVVEVHCNSDPKNDYCEYKAKWKI